MEILAIYFLSFIFFYLIEKDNTILSNFHFSLYIVHFIILVVKYLLSYVATCKWKRLASHVGIAWRDVLDC